MNLHIAAFTSFIVFPGGSSKHLMSDTEGEPVLGDRYDRRVLFLACKDIVANHPHQTKAAVSYTPLAGGFIGS
jgi:hypothetical protein